MLSLSKYEAATRYTVMTPTIGIDLVEIKRFQHWHNYTDKQLRKLFSQTEITYCRAVSSKSAERFAVRFAAKEALFKALAPYARGIVPLFTLCAASEIASDQYGVRISTQWDMIKNYYPTLDTNKLSIQTSLSHTETTACAVVIIIIS